MRYTKFERPVPLEVYANTRTHTHPPSPPPPTHTHTCAQAIACESIHLFQIWSHLPQALHLYNYQEMHFAARASLHNITCTLQCPTVTLRSNSSTHRPAERRKKQNNALCHAYIPQVSVSSKKQSARCVALVVAFHQALNLRCLLPAGRRRPTGATIIFPFPRTPVSCWPQIRKNLVKSGLHFSTACPGDGVLFLHPKAPHDFRRTKHISHLWAASKLDPGRIEPPNLCSRLFHFAWCLCCYLLSSQMIFIALL